MSLSKVSKHNQHFILTNDKVIRAALLASLEAQHRNHVDTRIIEELGVTHGEARVDIAVVNGEIHGYELKSDLDTLKRLPNQISLYNRTLDKVTLVVGKNHLIDAIKIVPDWWGITIAKFTEPSQTISFFKIREPERNQEQCGTSVAALLWREEALQILENMGQAKGVRSKPRAVVYERLASVLDKETLNRLVREQLRSRINWRSESQCIPSGG